MSMQGQAIGHCFGFVHCVLGNASRMKLACVFLVNLAAEFVGDKENEVWFSV